MALRAPMPCLYHGYGIVVPGRPRCSTGMWAWQLVEDFTY